MIPRFRALACQTIVRPITEDVMTRKEGRAIIKDNLDAALNLMWKGLGNNLGAVKLVTFPEMFLTLAPVWRNRKSSDWLELACVEVPGPELEPLFAAAREAQIFIGANVYEYDPKWPGRYFNCSLLISPEGEVILKYRRLHSTLTPSPHDFLDDYVDALGWDALFPVADTEIGKIAMFPCREITFPEVARMFALKGAELLLHPTNDSADFPGWTACKQARALENNCYLIEEVRPAGESMKARGLIDIEQLRGHRHSGNVLNVIAQLRTELYTEYKKTITPPNRFKDPMTDSSELRNLYAEIMERMTEEGIFPRPMYSSD